MAFVDPNTIHNPATNTVPPASWGDTVRDDLVWLNDPPRCKVYDTANQTLTTSTVTAVDWNSERWDTDTIHDNAASNSRLTCQTAGRYLVEARIVFEAAAGGYREAKLWKNGTAGTWLDTGYELAPGASIGGAIYVCQEINLAVADYVEVYAWQNTGAGLDVLQGGGDSTSWFRMRMVSA